MPQICGGLRQHGRAEAVQDLLNPGGVGAENGREGGGGHLLPHALLLTAAVAGRVALICHREAWDFLAACASENEHFCKTTEVCDDGDGRVRAVLSGRSVIGLLIALRDTRSTASMDGTWAMASAFYRRLAEDLTTTSRHGTQPLTVIFDDGVHDHAPVTETPP